MSNVIVAQGPCPQVTDVVTTAVVPQGPRIRGDYPTRTSIALGIVEIVSGVLAVIFGICAILWHSYSGGSGYGIWCGVPIIGGGVAGIFAGTTRNEQAITAFLVMSIVDICIACLMAIIALVAFINDRNDSFFYGLIPLDTDNHDERVAFSSTLLAIAIVAASAFLWSSIISGNCCRFSPTASTYITHTTTPTVTTHTVMAGQTQMPVYPQQPQMQYAYNGPAQSQYGAPMPPQPAQPVQPPQYGVPPGSYEKPPAYAPQ